MKKVLVILIVFLSFVASAQNNDCEIDIAPRKISYHELLNNIRESFGLPGDYVIANRKDTLLDGPRRNAIVEFRDIPTHEGLVKLLENLLPVGARFKELDTFLWNSIEPAAADFDASIGFVHNDDFAVSADRGAEKFLFYASAKENSTQTIYPVIYKANRMLRIRLKDTKPPVPSADASQFINQELTLYYKMRELDRIVIRNKGPGLLARWRERTIYLPSELIVQKNWLTPQQIVRYEYMYYQEK